MTRFSLMTYNVYGRRFHLETRLPAIFSLLANCGADVICLQEVMPWFYKLLKGKMPPGYRLHAVFGNGFVKGGLVMLAKQRVTRTRYVPFITGIYGRGVLLAEVDHRLGKIVIASTHLTSRPSAGRIRAKQLQKMQAAVGAGAHAIMTGDFNFGVGEQPESRLLHKDYVDAWSALRPRESGYTWDRRKNHLARINSYKNEGSRRLDRVFLRSPKLKPVAIRLLGTKPLTRKQPIVFPSDHFAVLCTIGRR